MIKIIRKNFSSAFVAFLFINLFIVLSSSAAQAHDGNQKLAGIVLDRTEDQRKRDIYRHPVQTLSFFHIEPGMRVAEALPGGGWYSRILAEYIGAEGALFGINYDDEIWPLFGFFSEERIEQLRARTKAFPDMIKGFTDNGINTGGFTFSTAPNNINGSLDRVLFIRALHNLNRFENAEQTMTEALTLTNKLLKADGLVGVVQHRAPETSSDGWANGSAGYLKQSTVVALFEKAGFELIASSEINANPKDKPTEKDNVWRLPPNLSGSDDDPQKREQMKTIGESDRMTLLFKKQGVDISH